MTTLPAVSRQMSRASRIGTPDAIRVPKVRLNRATTTLRAIGPTTGRRSFSRSRKRRPGAVRARNRMPMTNRMRIAPSTYHWSIRKRENACRARVGARRSPAPGRLWNTCSNFGTTKIMMRSRIESVTVSDDRGVDQRALHAATQALRLLHEAREARTGSRRARRRSRRPSPCSSRGCRRRCRCFAMASDSGDPLSTSSVTSTMTLLKGPRSICPSRIFRLRTIGRPASCSVESCVVNSVSACCETRSRRRRARAGAGITAVVEPRDGVPRVAVADVFARAGILGISIAPAGRAGYVPLEAVRPDALGLGPRLTRWSP